MKLPYDTLNHNSKDKTRSEEEYCHLKTKIIDDFVFFINLKKKKFSLKSLNDIYLLQNILLIIIYNK